MRSKFPTFCGHPIGVILSASASCLVKSSAMAANKKHRRAKKYGKGRLKILSRSSRKCTRRLVFSAHVPQSTEKTIFSTRSWNTSFPETGEELRILYNTYQKILPSETSRRHAPRHYDLTVFSCNRVVAWFLRFEKSRLSIRILKEWYSRWMIDGGLLLYIILFMVYYISFAPIY